MAKTESFTPDFSFEVALIGKGARLVAGTDEVGRGPLAGCVLSAAVILDPERIPQGLNDSKKLSAKRREELFEEICATATVSYASVSAYEIDQTDIRKASLESMRLAVARLEKRPDHVLVDGNAIPPNLGIPATFIIKGDARSASISAAAIVAKVVRDRMMKEACLQYPGYGFSKHAGYGTAEHLEAIARLGPTPIHRMSFRPLKDRPRHG